jgi:hypothetical protein
VTLSSIPALGHFRAASFTTSLEPIPLEGPRQGNALQVATRRRSYPKSKGRAPPYWELHWPAVMVGSGFGAGEGWRHKPSQSRLIKIVPHPSGILLQAWLPEQAYPLGELFLSRLQLHATGCEGEGSGSGEPERLFSGAPKNISSTLAGSDHSEDLPDSLGTKGFCRADILYES